MSQPDFIKPDWRWGTAEGSREFDRLLDRSLTFREKLEWLEEAETLTLQLRASREKRHPTKFAWTDHMADLARRAALILAEKMNAEAVWLFGSVARRDWDADSDIDLLVVVSDSEQPRHRRAQRAHFLTEEIHAPKDLIVLTHKEWESEQLAPASLANTIKREGVCLHGRGE